MTAACGVCKRNVNSESRVKPAGSAILVTLGQRWVQPTLPKTTDSTQTRRLTHLRDESSALPKDGGLASQKKPLTQGIAISAGFRDISAFEKRSGWIRFDARRP